MESANGLVEQDERAGTQAVVLQRYENRGTTAVLVTPDLAEITLPSHFLPQGTVLGTQLQLQLQPQLQPCQDHSTTVNPLSSPPLNSTNSLSSPESIEQISDVLYAETVELAIATLLDRETTPTVEPVSEGAAKA